ncbi:helix-turn-helix domain-containing protein [Mesorhizobium sp. BR1-1-9]|uniref:helix-turn-helix domain-containing protein n=1 Tax=unclassified Mesorhizobium TaxID=325217 RepID=UPI001CD0B944|nr:helix-turn-helix domain-containing protein [Mesorhizobium sp. BR1-1-13]MBZ9874684.1 helix-turn-helix domain-containing protein [Mesorhizobium sp. BR1-1-9]MBZ9942150.1 helix-turn-helix domain-containing protein [Mesorhizobium sp. BR1-1-13]
MDERRKIERSHHAGVSVDAIAEKLGRHRSTIFRRSRGISSGEPRPTPAEARKAASWPSI